MKSHRLPELISGRIKKEWMGTISMESIYNRIFSEKRYLIHYLRRYNKAGVCKKRQFFFFFFNEEAIVKDRAYKKRGSYKIKASRKIKEIIRITDRPKEINKRSAFGLMETDLYFCYSYCSWQK